MSRQPLATLFVMPIANKAVQFLCVKVFFKENILKVWFSNTNLLNFIDVFILGTKEGKQHDTSN